MLAAGADPDLVREGDNWTATITLREGMTWSDGEAVTADDFVFSVNTNTDLGLAGTWLGLINTRMYTDLFRFPMLLYRPSTSAMVIAIGVSLAAALLGSVGAVGRAAGLPPAQAMNPPAPAVFRRMRWSDTRAARWLDQGSRIIVRNIVRSPARSLLTMAGAK